MSEQIVRIRKKDAALLEGMDPFGRLLTLDVPGNFALAALSEDEDGKKEPVGLITAYADEKCVTVTWIVVTPPMQGKGIGEMLLLKVFDIADKGNIPVVEAVISSEFEKETYFSGGGSFFRDRLFEKEKPMPAEYYGVLGELCNLEYMQQNPKKLPRPTKLSDLHPDRINAALEMLDAIPEASGLYCTSKSMKGLITDISYLFMDGNEAYSALLIRETDDCLIPVYFYAESDNEAAALIVNAVAAAAEKYGRSKEVQIMFRTDSLNSLMDKVFAGRKSKGTLLSADVTEYRRQKEEQ